MIVNADDFGYSKVDNSVIAECFKRKIITHTTAIVNADGFEDCIKVAKENKFEDYVGLHINLTEFKPLTKNIINNPKFCKDGMFFNNPKNRGFSSFVNFKKKDICDLEEEIEAQMVKFKEAFPNSTFLDSHHHIHTVYPIYKVVSKLAKKYGFKRIRISGNIGINKLSLKGIYKNSFNRKIKKQFIDSCLYFGDSLNNFDTLNNCEMMVHPYMKDDHIFDKLTQIELKGVGNE